LDDACPAGDVPVAVRRNAKRVGVVDKRSAEIRRLDEPRQLTDDTFAHERFSGVAWWRLCAAGNSGKFNDAVLPAM
jgi:hypothetical protein